MKVVMLDTSKCISVLAAIKLAINVAAANFSTETFVWAGITVHVEEDSDPDLLLRDHVRCDLGCLGDTRDIGPYPPEKLTPEEEANDARVIERLRAERMFPSTAHSNPNFSW